MNTLIPDLQQGLAILGIGVVLFLLILCGVMFYLKTRSDEEVDHVEFKLMQEQIKADGLEARLKAEQETVEEHRDRIKSLIGELHNGGRKTPNGDDSK